MAKVSAKGVAGVAGAATAEKQTAGVVEAMVAAIGRGW